MQFYQWGLEQLARENYELAFSEIQSGWLLSSFALENKCNVL